MERSRSKDEKGQTIAGKEALLELGDDWQHGGAYISDEPGKLREAFHLVVSMPEGTDERGVRLAAVDFAARVFSGHSYVLAQHTYETDPGPRAVQAPRTCTSS